MFGRFQGSSKQFSGHELGGHELGGHNDVGRRDVGHKVSDGGTGQTWPKRRFPAGSKVVLCTTRPALQHMIVQIVQSVGVLLTHDSDSAMPGDLIVLDHLFPEPPEQHFGNVVVVGMLGEERSLLPYVRFLGAAHAVVLPTGRDWLLQFVAESVIGAGPDSDAVDYPGGRSYLGTSPDLVTPLDLVAPPNPVTPCRSGGPGQGPDPVQDRYASAGPSSCAADLGGSGSGGDDAHMPDAHMPVQVVEYGPRRGLCIAVIPGCGGCGASTVAIALGMAAAQFGDALVVAADAWGHGLGVSLDSSPTEPEGWQAIAPDTQQIDAVELRAALPREAGFWLLKGSRGVVGDTPEALPAVLAAARDGFDVTVVDLGRTTASVSAARLCDTVVLVLPTTLAGVLGARRVLEQLALAQGSVGPVSAVLACRDVGGLTAHDIADYLGHEVALVMGSSRLIAERAAAGELVQGRSGRKLLAWGERLLAALT